MSVPRISDTGDPKESAKQTNRAIEVLNSAIGSLPTGEALVNVSKDGSVIKLASVRIQICLADIDIDCSTSESNVFGTTAGTTYRGAATWTYPSSFKGNPRVFTSEEDTSLKGTAYSISAMSCQYQIKATSSVTVHGHIMAIGAY